MPARAPLPLDILYRPIKVVQGGVFIASGQTYPHTRGVIMRGDDKEWSEIRTISDGDVADSIQCLACGIVKDKIVYVVGGLTVDDVPDASRYGVSQFIYSSDDGGKTWIETRRKDGGFVYVMAWDSKNKMFYAQAIADWFTPGENANTLQVLASPDGHSWEVAGSHGQDVFSTYASPLLTATGTELLKDGDDNIVPNGGFAGWTGIHADSGSPDNRPFIIAPTDLNCYSQHSPGDGAGTVEITGQIIDPETGKPKTIRKTVSLPMQTVQCVALAGYTYAAGGNNDQETGVIAVSQDGGDSWKTVYEGSNIIFNIVGTPT